jgi:hypothetical protein
VNCRQLASVTIGTNVPAIGTGVFEVCNSLTSLTIPNSVTSIGEGVFVNCANLTNVTIPNSVTAIGEEAFEYCPSLTSIVIPNSVTTFGTAVFYGCHSLTGVYFQGNPPTPTNDLTGFIGDNNAVAYYLPGTMGWGSTFDGVPTVMWNPQAQTGDGRFGVLTNQFGFNITGSSNLVIVVEACTNLANPFWTPVGTTTLNTFVGTNGTSYFSDPQWTNYSSRYYRFTSP